jgi:solute carrier family 25 citrate transporter 1
MSHAKGKAKEKPIASLLAGATAGGVESFITFPLESLKTQLQFGALEGKSQTPLQALRGTLAQRGVGGLYAGCTAVVIGNAVKAGVRFTTYDQFKSLLKDEEVGPEPRLRGRRSLPEIRRVMMWSETDPCAQGKLTAPRSMLAGLGAGMMEAIIAVTPSETIKWVWDATSRETHTVDPEKLVDSALMQSRTKMIEDSKRPEPRFRGMNDAVRTIVKEEGYLGIYRGLGPVVRESFRPTRSSHSPCGDTDELMAQMLRQGANSAVRFSSYSTLKQLAQGSVVAGSQLPGWMTFGIGATAGVITVCKSDEVEFELTRRHHHAIRVSRSFAAPDRFEACHC